MYSQLKWSFESFVPTRSNTIMGTWYGLQSSYILWGRLIVRSDCSVLRPAKGQQPHGIHVQICNGFHAITSFQQQKHHGRPALVLKNLVDCLFHGPNIPTMSYTYCDRTQVMEDFSKRIQELCYSRFVGCTNGFGRPIPLLQVANEFSTELHSLIWRLSKGKYFPGRDAKSPHVRALGKLPGI